MAIPLPDPANLSDMGFPGGPVDSAWIYRALYDILTNVGNMAINTDQVEALLTALGQYTDDIEPLLVTLNGYMVATDLLLTGTNTYVDGLEGLITTLNTYVDGLEGFVDGLETALALLNVRSLGAVTKLVDNQSGNYTSAALDCRTYNGLFTYTKDEGSFAGTIIVQGALGDGAAPTTDYQQEGAALTLGRVETFENIAPFIKANVVRTAGGVSVWVQPFSRR